MSNQEEVESVVNQNTHQPALLERLQGINSYWKAEYGNDNPTILEAITAFQSQVEGAMAEPICRQGNVRELLEQAAEQYYGAPLVDDYFDTHPDILGWFLQFILLKSEAPKHPQAEAVEQEPFITILKRHPAASGATGYGLSTDDHKKLCELPPETKLYLHPPSPRASNAKDGWKLVPIEPEPTMITKGMMALIQCMHSELDDYSPELFDGYKQEVIRVYKAMILVTSALPEPSVQETK